MLLFEVFFRLLLASDLIKGHTNSLLAILLKVEECIWILKLVEVPLNVLVVVHVFHELGAPFSTLLVVHEFLAIEVVKQNANL